MNRTKKRAHKRAQARVGFKYPYPLTRQFKIQNLKAVRAHFGLGLGEAKARVEEDMGQIPRRPPIPLDLLI